MCSLIGSLLILAITNVTSVEEGLQQPEENEIRKGWQGHNGKWRNFVTDINPSIGKNDMVEGLTRPLNEMKR